MPHVARGHSSKTFIDPEKRVRNVSMGVLLMAGFVGLSTSDRILTSFVAGGESQGQPGQTPPPHPLPQCELKPTLWVENHSPWYAPTQRATIAAEGRAVERDAAVRGDDTPPTIPAGSPGGGRPVLRQSGWKTRRRRGCRAPGARAHRTDRQMLRRRHGPTRPAIARRTPPAGLEAEAPLAPPQSGN